MPRLARKYLQSCYNHIIVQGINKEYIFNSDELKKAYKTILEKNLKDTNIFILAYCIMDNHTHILVYSDEIKEVAKLMQKTNTSYAKLYNKEKNRVGYVFRDRYYSQPIMTEQQLWSCIAYIHNNPIVAKMVNKPFDYRYSSYSEYVEKKGIIGEESIKLAFGSRNNYIEIFRGIHNDDNLGDIMEVKDPLKNSEEVIQNYLKKNNKTLEEITRNHEKICELVMNLREESGLSLRTLSKILGINKNRLNKIINKNL